MAAAAALGTQPAALARHVILMAYAEQATPGHRQEHALTRLQIKHKAYAGKSLFEQFELQLAPGELLCLLGPSGCGKTTLLNLIAGLDPDFSGKLVRPASQPSLSYMFQQPRLLPWRTLRQNLAWVIKPNQHARIEPLLKQMGLLEYADAYPNRLSLGMARRAALARCLIVEPQLILLDEPFVSLDPPATLEMHQLIRQLRLLRPHSAIVLVTHDLREAITLADRILLLGGQPTQILHQWQSQRPLAERGKQFVIEQELALLRRYPDF